MPKKKPYKAKRPLSNYICITCERYIHKKDLSRRTILVGTKNPVSLVVYLCPDCGKIVHLIWNIPLEVAQRMWYKSTHLARMELVKTFGKKNLKVRDKLIPQKYNQPTPGYKKRKNQLELRKEREQE